MAGRVIPTAEALGADVYSPPGALPEQWMQNNRDWINQMMDEGCTILDCGAAPGRANYPNPTSPYYQMELDEILGRGYSNYIQISPVGEWYGIERKAAFERAIWSVGYSAAREGRLEYSEAAGGKGVDQGAPGSWLPSAGHRRRNVRAGSELDGETWFLAAKGQEKAGDKPNVDRLYVTVCITYTSGPSAGESASPVWPLILLIFGH